MFHTFDSYLEEIHTFASIYTIIEHQQVQGLGNYSARESLSQDNSSQVGSREHLEQVRMSPQTSKEKTRLNTLIKIFKSMTDEIGTIRWVDCANIYVNPIGMTLQMKQIPAVTVVLIIKR